MVKNILFLLLAANAGLSFGQALFGVKAGANYVNNISDFEPSFSTSNFIETDYQYRVSYHFGGFFTIQ